MALRIWRCNDSMSLSVAPTALGTARWIWVPDSHPARVTSGPTTFLPRARRIRTPRRASVTAKWPRGWPGRPPREHPGGLASSDLAGGADLLEAAGVLDAAGFPGLVGRVLGGAGAGF